MQTLFAEKLLKTKEKPPYFQQIRWISMAEKEGFELEKAGYIGKNGVQPCYVLFE